MRRAGAMKVRAVVTLVAITLAVAGQGLPSIAQGPSASPGSTADGVPDLSGLTPAEIDAAARARGVGVISSGNFSITAAMAQAAAVLVARHLPASVHSAVRAAGHREAHLAAQHRGESVLDRGLHGADPRLGGPAAEVRAVVLEQQASGHPRLRATISAYSF